jgi:hypothetical protein
MGQDVFSQVFASGPDAALHPLIAAIEAASVGACLVAPDGVVLLEMALVDNCNWHVDRVDGTASFRTDDRRASDVAYLSKLYPGVTFRIISWDATDFPSAAWETRACYNAKRNRFTQLDGHEFVAPHSSHMPATWPSGVWAARKYFPEDTERHMDDLIEEGRALRPQIEQRLEQLFPRNTVWQLQNGRVHYDRSLTFDIRASGREVPTSPQLERAIDTVTGQRVHVAFVTSSGRWHARLEM